jgi:ubiquinone biosynthesis protein UbiJ
VSAAAPRFCGTGAADGPRRDADQRRPAAHEGSSSTLLDLQRVISELDIDWEAPLVSGLGDVLGHQLAEMLRGAVSWSREASASLRRQLSEFALEEARLAPPAAALEAFYADVRQLTSAANASNGVSPACASASPDCASA